MRLWSILPLQFLVIEYFSPFYIIFFFMVGKGYK